MTTIETLKHARQKLQKQQSEFMTDAGVVWPRYSQPFNQLQKKINDFTDSIDYLTSLGVA